MKQEEIILYRECCKNLVVENYMIDKFCFECLQQMMIKKIGKEKLIKELEK